MSLWQTTGMFVWDFLYNEYSIFCFGSIILWFISRVVFTWDVITQKLDLKLFHRCPKRVSPQRACMNEAVVHALVPAVNVAIEKVSYARILLTPVNAKERIS